MVPSTSSEPLAMPAPPDSSLFSQVCSHVSQYVPCNFKPTWLRVSVTCNQKHLTHGNWNALYKQICFLLEMEPSNSLWVKEFILPTRHEAKGTIIEHLLCVQHWCCVFSQTLSWLTSKMAAGVCLVVYAAVWEMGGWVSPVCHSPHSCWS